MSWIFADQKFSWCPMSKDAIPDMGNNAEFGWCLAVLVGPQGKDRFYGPFECESIARAWIKGQPFMVCCHSRQKSMIALGEDYRKCGCLIPGLAQHINNPVCGDKPEDDDE